MEGCERPVWIGVCQRLSPGSVKTVESVVLG